MVHQRRQAHRLLDISFRAFTGAERNQTSQLPDDMPLIAVPSQTFRDQRAGPDQIPGMDGRLAHHPEGERLLDFIANDLEQCLRLQRPTGEARLSGLHDL